jgi:hypothetical protein
MTDDLPGSFSSLIRLYRTMPRCVIPSDALRLPGFVVCLAVLGLLAPGCGRGGLETAEVTGRVTVNGQPLSSGTVAFMSPQGPVAKGQINSDGSFRMDPYDPSAGKGVVVGRYEVIISAPDPKAQAAVKGHDYGSIPSLIPERYTVAATSGLSFEVKPGQRNVANFELTKP